MKLVLLKQVLKISSPYNCELIILVLLYDKIEPSNVKQHNKMRLVIDVTYNNDVEITKFYFANNTSPLYI